MFWLYSITSSQVISQLWGRTHASILISCGVNLIATVTCVLIILYHQRSSDYSLLIIRTPLRLRLRRRLRLDAPPPPPPRRLRLIDSTVSASTLRLDDSASTLRLDDSATTTIRRVSCLSKVRATVGREFQLMFCIPWTQFVYIFLLSCKYQYTKMSLIFLFIAWFILRFERLAERVFTRTTL